MTILIDHQEAVIREDLSFDYIAKNSLFDTKDDYTLEIIFPLKDCLRNRRIFGIAETVPEQITTPYDCRIIEGDFRKTGILKILSVTEADVHGQFIEQALSATARSEWENTLLTDLDLAVTGNDTGESVPVWDSRTETVLRNNDEAVQPGEDEELPPEYRQFYFRTILSAVIEQLGYTPDFSLLTDHYLFQHLLCLNPVYQEFRTVNGRPQTIFPLRQALPAWTVQHLFDQTEAYFAVRVVVDAEAAVIRLVPLNRLYNPGTVIPVTPAEEHETETLDDDQTAYYKDILLKYAESPDTDDAQWFIDLMEEQGLVTHFASLAGLTATLREHMLPVANEDPTLYGRTFNGYDGYNWQYPGDPEDEAYDTDAFRRWFSLYRQDFWQTRHDGNARQFGTQLLEAEGHCFLVTEAQSDTVYRVMRRLVPLGARSSSPATLGTRSSSLATETIDLTPVRFHTVIDGTPVSLPVIRTPEPVNYNVDYDEANSNPALLYAVFKQGKPEGTYSDTLYVALFQRCTDLSGNTSATLLWTYDERITESILQAEDAAYPWFNAIGTSTADGIIRSPFPRFADGEMQSDTAVDMTMPYATAVSTVQSVWADLFPLLEKPSPFPTLDLGDAVVQRSSPATEITESTNLTPAVIRAALPDFDRTRRYTFSFLYDGMPDPKAVFRIRGHNYLCRQLTVRVTPEGIGRLKKGEFYRIPEVIVRDTDLAQEMVA